MPYWNNSADTSNEKVKVSYYKYITLANEFQLLAFVVNISSQEIKNVKLSFDEQITKSIDAKTTENIGFEFDIEPYGYRILYIS